MAKCIACDGSGYYDNTNSPKCSSCNGTGVEQPPKPHPYKYVRFWESNTLALTQLTDDYDFHDYVRDRVNEINDLGPEVLFRETRHPKGKPIECVIQMICTDEEYQCLIDLYSKSAHPFDYYPPNHVENF